MVETETDKARIARQFIEAIPFSPALQMRLDEIGDGVARCLGACGGVARQPPAAVCTGHGSFPDA